MKVELIENAIDSLQIAMNAFIIWNNEFESKHNFRNLKITIEFLHNTMELLLKAILISENEEIIYYAENEKQKNNLEKAKNEANIQKISLMEYVIKNNEIKTLSYNDVLKKCIEARVFFNTRAKISLEKLGTYRNRIMHLGIDVNEDLADLLAVIHENFKLVIEDSFYEKLLDLSDYFSYNDVLDTIEPWQEICNDSLRLLSIDDEKRQLKKFDKMIENVIKSNKFINFLSRYNIELINKSVYRENNIDLEFRCDKKQVYFTTEYDALYNFTLIVIQTYCFKVVFGVMHFENKIAIGKKWIEYDDYALESIYDRNENFFEVKLLTENNIRNCLINSLRKTILSDSWKIENC